jgi:hypothetical protein
MTTRLESLFVWKMIALFIIVIYSAILASVFVLIIYNGSWTIHRDLLTPTDLSFVLFGCLSAVAFIFMEIKNAKQES